MLCSRSHLRRSVLPASLRLSLQPTTLPHNAPLQLFALYDARPSKPRPPSRRNDDTVNSTCAMASKIDPSHCAVKHQRSLSTRERLGLPPIIRVDKSKIQSIPSQCPPEWNTSQPQNQQALELAASTKPVLEGIAVRKSSEDSSTETPATTENPVENNVLAGIRDAKLIFNEAWSKIEARYGKSNLSFPKEIIWLMGAPGSGKGTHTPFLLQARGITNPPINMSSLLTKVSAAITADLRTIPFQAEKDLSDKNAVESTNNFSQGDNTTSASLQVQTLEKEITSVVSKLPQETANGGDISTDTAAQELAELQDQINKGKMIPDGKVLEILLHALLDCDANIGVLVDGFPRTEVQVECLKLFYDKMHSLRRDFWDTKMSHRFPRPVFRICVLFVDEDVSVQRQLSRGRTILGNNAMVRKTGQGRLMEERVTDYDESLIRERYKIFKEHYGALLKLAKIFPFHLINALGSIEDVMNMILKEFEYQSSLELDEETFEAIAHIPIAGKIGVHARQDLLRRLEEYQLSNAHVLKEAVAFVDEHVMPTVTRHAISGSALIRSEDVRLENQLFVDIILDVLSERGYHVTFDARRHLLPVRVDRETFEIITKHHYIYVFNIRFPRHNIQPIEQKMIPQSPIQFSPNPQAPTTTAGQPAGAHAQ